MLYLYSIDMSTERYCIDMAAIYQLKFRNESVNLIGMMLGNDDIERRT